MLIIRYQQYVVRGLLFVSLICAGQQNFTTIEPTDCFDGRQKTVVQGENTYREVENLEEHTILTARYKGIVVAPRIPALHGQLSSCCLVYIDSTA